MKTRNKKSTSQVQEEIVRLAVTSLVAAGYTLTVDNGGDEDEITNSTDVEAVLAVMGATADETLYAQLEGKPTRFVSLIYGYGNAGWEVISDYTAALEEVLKPANELAQQYMEADEE